ncbi:substrate-binding domain-containing protein [Virgibacillus sp. NKC19-3]|uniref:LacI family DNA-binding transcriptional regulator n=1 Tax=Virgibacillus saliphilus TaxID=2831674 RepID=UPI001C9B0BF0|nr:substrate-binding domain-containing protein [Virgibacillus sp. NKC19-3]MBY7144215.1 substrate-binding domain-containing protein [Virgibacillus sp. NKC19-3]
MKRATMNDVAQLANVSKSTVSQYLNRRYDYMGEKTKKRIEEAINELGYQSNYLARSLKQKRTFTIGVIVANILHSFSTRVIRAIEDECNEQDIHVIVCNADDDPIKEKKYIDMLRAKQVDGLIVFPTDGNVDLYKKMVDEEFPLVFIDRKVEDLQVDTFLLDNENASKMAVDYFIKSGHSRIGMITSSLIHNVTPRVERIEGYKKALKAHGIQPVKEYIKGLEVHEIKKGLEEIFSLEDPPTALFTGNDLTLMEVLNFTKENNMKIPDDFALISIDDVSFANIYDPTLTTVAQPAFSIGKEASKFLLQRINKDINTDPKIHRFKAELIVRTSC